MKNTSCYDLVIAGSGPAGLAAASFAAEKGAKVLVLEKMPRPAVKMRASGGTKCNFTNVLPESDFMAAFGRNGRFMANALAFAGRDWLLKYMRKNGVEPVVAEGMFFFPRSGKAEDVVNAFLKPALEAGVEIRCGVSLQKIIVKDGSVTGALLGDNSEIKTSKLLLAAGGEAAPALGGTDSGIKIAAAAGHKTIKMVPALAPLVTDEKWPGELAGVSLTDCRISCGTGRKKALSRNVLLFTKEGLSGSAALNISGSVHRMIAENGGAVGIRLELLPDMGCEDIFRFLDRAKDSEPQKFLRSSLSCFFPHSLAAVICRNTVGEDIRNRDLSRHKQTELAQYLAALPLTISRDPGFRQAMAADGGVSLKEINPATMESRLVKGLFFAGEIVDLTGPCGGFNIQFAIASGRLAAASAVKYIQFD